MDITRFSSSHSLRPCWTSCRITVTCVITNTAVLMGRRLVMTVTIKWLALTHRQVSISSSCYPRVRVDLGLICKPPIMSLFMTRTETHRWTFRHKIELTVLVKGVVCVYTDLSPMAPCSKKFTNVHWKNYIWTRWWCSKAGCNQRHRINCQSRKCWPWFVLGPRRCLRHDTKTSMRRTLTASCTKVRPSQVPWRMRWNHRCKCH